MEISDIAFDAQGLVPCVVQEWSTGEVLMLAYMNQESVERTLDTGQTWFWSRSRGRLWNKGETSGNVQRVLELRYDCDADTLLALVEQTGPACHTGAHSCFDGRLLSGSAAHPGGGSAEGSAAPHPAAGSGVGFAAPHPAAGSGVGSADTGPLFLTLTDLERTISGRKGAPPESSYTARLFLGGVPAIGAKVVEEAAEVVEAAESGDVPHTVYEAGDVLYHLLVLLAHAGIPLADVMAELERRKA
ncbi:MAG: bifunctional phosphoribosyl-AMP cyclohydrolase/phosphoribosyl-ATP diphosphatase HisIE [Thermoleophilia bacterium]